MRTFDYIVSKINTATSPVMRRRCGSSVCWISLASSRSLLIASSSYASITRMRNYSRSLPWICSRRCSRSMTKRRASARTLRFPDNAAVLTLIEGRMGIIDVLNEECVRPRGSDEGFVSKLTTLHGTEV